MSLFDNEVESVSLVLDKSIEGSPPITYFLGQDG